LPSAIIIVFSISPFSLELGGDKRDQTGESCFYLLSSKSSLLNGRKFAFKGTTLVPSFKEFGPLLSYSVMEQDIKIIKETGFNSIRFINSIPHPYYLELCREYGLLALIEMPLSNIPQQLAGNPNFTIEQKLLKAS
jgi:beta-galactosidase